MFLPGVKTTAHGVKTKGKECGSGLSCHWWRGEHCVMSPNHDCEGDYNGDFYLFWENQSLQ